MRRDPYLDFLRALAIILVLVHHVSQQWPVPLPLLTKYTHYGAIGVDLFFVLSGFLIGGIFWREVRETGRVNLWRFWWRRWLRTLPPYFAGLVLAWGAVSIYRGESFDLGYLLFLQNYYEVMPFFLVSWSLCVEEHFYLSIPLLFFILIRHGKSRVGLVLSVILLVPLVSRFAIAGQATSAFGYYVTASHLNADGLLLGFGVAYLRYFKDWKITPKVRWWSFLALMAILPLFFLEVSGSTGYIYGRFLVAILFVSLLLLSVENDFARHLAPRPVVFIALTSYSVYLTHALVIHGVDALFHDLATDYPSLYFMILIGGIFLVGWMFYRTFELSALKLRQRLVPSTC